MLKRVTTPITTPIQITHAQVLRSITGAPGRRGGRAITSSVSGSTPMASAGPESVTRLIHRIWVASSGRAISSGPPEVSPSQPASTTPPNTVHDLAEVGREQVAQELADVVVDQPALPHGSDDRCEVVVGQHHVGGLLAHLRARSGPSRPRCRRPSGPARRSPRPRSSRRPARRPAGHGRAPACGRGPPGRRPQPAVTRDSSHSGEPASRSAPVVTAAPGSQMPRSAAIRAAVAGWSPVIMTTLMPGPVRLCDGRDGFGPRRVDDADRAGVDESVLQPAGVLGAQPVQHRALLVGVEPGVADPQRPVGVAGEALDAGRIRARSLIGERHGLRPRAGRQRSGRAGRRPRPS